MIEIPQIKSIKRNVIRDDIIPYLTDLFKILFKLLVSDISFLMITYPVKNPSKMQKIGTPIPAPTQRKSMIA